MKIDTSQKTGDIIRKLREDKALPLRKVAAQLDIDTSFLSKIERSERRATREQITKLAKILEVEKDYLMIPFLSEIVYYEIADEECANKVLKVAEQKVKYLKQTKQK